jgi:membrane protein YqaA with SNARE-associated domain
MKLFTMLYEKVMTWSRLPNAQWYLSALSFAESSFFPIPPDVMLAPMSLATPSKAWRYAFMTTIASVLGGLFGYFIGATALDLILPYIQSHAKYWEAFQTAKSWFESWGFWAIFVAGFTPIPYKVFTIAAGSLAMPIIPFIFGSVIGRGMRFYLVAGLMKWGGPTMETKLKQYIDYIGWAVIAIAMGVIIFANS